MEEGGADEGGTEDARGEEGMIIRMAILKS